MWPMRIQPWGGAGEGNCRIEFATVVNLYETLSHSLTTALPEILQNPLDMA
jgi:hypothetical protein